MHSQDLTHFLRMSPVLNGTILCSICPNLRSDSVLKYSLHSIYCNHTYLVYEPVFSLLLLTYIFKMIFMKYVTIRYLGVLSALPSFICWPFAGPVDYLVSSHFVKYHIPNPMVHCLQLMPTIHCWPQRAAPLRVQW